MSEIKYGYEVCKSGALTKRKPTENKKPPEAPSGGLMQEASRARRISVLCRFDYY